MMLAVIKVQQYNIIETMLCVLQTNLDKNICLMNMAPLDLLVLNYWNHCVSVCVCLYIIKSMFMLHVCMNVFEFERVGVKRERYVAAGLWGVAAVT